MLPGTCAALRVQGTTPGTRIPHRHLAPGSRHEHPAIRAERDRMDKPLVSVISGFPMRTCVATLQSCRPLPNPIVASTLPSGLNARADIACKGEHGPNALPTSAPVRMFQTADLAVLVSAGQQRAVRAERHRVHLRAGTVRLAGQFGPLFQHFPQAAPLRLVGAVAMLCTASSAATSGWLPARPTASPAVTWFARARRACWFAAPPETGLGRSRAGRSRRGRRRPR